MLLYLFITSAAVGVLGYGLGLARGYQWGKEDAASRALLTLR